MPFLGRYARSGHSKLCNYNANPDWVVAQLAALLLSNKTNLIETALAAEIHALTRFSFFSSLRYVRTNSTAQHPVNMATLMAKDVTFTA